MDEILFRTIANGSQYGNNAYISPNASINDGKLTICIIKNFKWWKAPIIGFRLFTKSITKSKYMQLFEFSNATLKMNEKNAQVDGESISCQSTVNIKVCKNSLKIIVPKK